MQIATGRCPFIFWIISSARALLKYVGEKWAGIFRLEMPDFHVALRDLLHSVNLRNGTHSFTSLPKKGMLTIFTP
jgi:hypothetical protein